MRFCLLLLTLFVCQTALAAEQTVVGKIESIDQRTIAIDGKTLLVSPKTRVTLDGNTVNLDSKLVSQEATVVYDDSLDVALSIAVGDQPDAMSLVALLQGTWYCVEGEELGKSQSRSTVREQDRRLKILRSRMTMERTTHAGKGKYVGLFDVDPAKQTFDFIGKGPKGNFLEWVGIYKLEGNRLTLCYRYQKEGRQNDHENSKPMAADQTSL